MSTYSFDDVRSMSLDEFCEACGLEISPSGRTMLQLFETIQQQTALPREQRAVLPLSPAIVWRDRPSKIQLMIIDDPVDMHRATAGLLMKWGAEKAEHLPMQDFLSDAQKLDRSLFDEKGLLEVEVHGTYEGRVHFDGAPVTSTPEGRARLLRELERTKPFGMGPLIGTRGTLQIGGTPFRQEDLARSLSKYESTYPGLFPGAPKYPEPDGPRLGETAGPFPRIPVPPKVRAAKKKKRKALRDMKRRQRS